MSLRTFVLSVAVAASLAACATSSGRTPLINAPNTPAAEGTIATSAEQNGNLQLEVSVKHVAPPERVSPGATAFVVWVQPRGGPPQNVGALQVDKDLNGHLRATTPFWSFDVFVTAEALPTVTAPTGPRTLSGSVAPTQ
jgi:hypothetical protein